MLNKIGKVIFAIGLVLTLTLGFTYQKEVYLLYKVSNAAFVSGFYCLCIALFIQVKNLSFFKTLAYSNYRRKMLVEKEEPVKELYEFVHERYAHKVSNGTYYLYAGVFLALAFVTALIG